jgi:hypothetical protein
MYYEQFEVKKSRIFEFRQAYKDSDKSPKFVLEFAQNELEYCAFLYEAGKQDAIGLLENTDQDHFSYEKCDTIEECLGISKERSKELFFGFRSTAEESQQNGVDNVSFRTLQIADELTTSINELAYLHFIIGRVMEASKNPLAEILKRLRG